MVDGSFVQGDVELEHLHEIRIGDALFKFVGERRRRATPPTTSTGASLGERRAKDSSRPRRRLADGPHRGRPRAHRADPAVVRHPGRDGDGQGGRRARAPPRLGAAGAACRPSTAPPSRTTCSRASCSATGAAPSAAPTATSRASSSWPTAGRCSSTRSATCRSRRRRSSCACSSRARSSRSAATAPEHVDVRVVCATHRDLHQFVKDGQVPRRPLRPRERARREAAAAARAQGGHLPAGAPFCGATGRPGCRSASRSWWRSSTTTGRSTCASSRAASSAATALAEGGRHRRRAAARDHRVAHARVRRALGGGRHRRSRCPSARAACRRPAPCRSRRRPPAVSSRRPPPTESSCARSPAPPPRQHRRRRPRARQGAHAGAPLDEALRHQRRGIPDRALTGAASARVSPYAEIRSAAVLEADEQDDGVVEELLVGDAGDLERRRARSTSSGPHVGGTRGGVWPRRARRRQRSMRSGRTSSTPARRAYSCARRRCRHPSTSGPRPRTRASMGPASLVSSATSASSEPRCQARRHAASTTSRSASPASGSRSATTPSRLGVRRGARERGRRLEHDRVGASRAATPRRRPPRAAPRPRRRVERRRRPRATASASVRRGCRSRALRCAGRRHASS